MIGFLRKLKKIKYFLLLPLFISAWFILPQNLKFSNNTTQSIRIEDDSSKKEKKPNENLGTTKAAPAKYELSKFVTFGKGIKYSESTNSQGRNILITYGGFTAKQDWCDSWTMALFNAKLKDMGVRHVYSVEGPNEMYYLNREIQTTLLANDLLKKFDMLNAGRTDTSIIIVIAHSSGVFEAHELFQKLYADTIDKKGVIKIDKKGITKNRIFFFSLEGDPGEEGGILLQHNFVDPLAKIYSVYAVDSTTMTFSAMKKYTQDVHRLFPEKTEMLVVNAKNCGCDKGADWCLHETVVIKKPHNKKSYDLKNDYTLSDDKNPVVTSYLDVLNNHPAIKNQLVSNPAEKKK